MRLALFMNPTLSYPGYYNPVHITLARSRDGSGNQTGDYVMLWTACQQGIYSQTVYNVGTGGTNNLDTSGYYIAALPYMGSSSSVGGTVAVCPAFQNIGGLTNPTPDLLVGKSGDFSAGTTASITVYSTSHTYLAVATSQFNNFLSGFTTALLMRYE
jgi:hypothetical protein